MHSYPIAKKSNVKECSNYHTIAVMSCASKVILKILQVMLQQYVTDNFQMSKLDFKKSEELESKLTTSVGS